VTQSHYFKKFKIMCKVLLGLGVHDKGKQGKGEGGLRVRHEITEYLMMGGKE
jgi:hypothetical protein